MFFGFFFVFESFKFLFYLSYCVCLVFILFDVLTFHYVSFIYKAYLCWAFVQCMCFECECGVSVSGLRDSILVLVLVV